VVDYDEWLAADITLDAVKEHSVLVFLSKMLPRYETSLAVKEKTRNEPCYQEMSLCI